MVIIIIIIIKGHKIDAVINMPAPKNVSNLKTFLGLLQFYRKFLQSHNCCGTIVLFYHKEHYMAMGCRGRSSFQKGQRYWNRCSPVSPISKCFIANISKRLTPSFAEELQLNKRETLAIIFALSKFHLFL